MSASVADLLALDALLDGMDDLQRISIERAIDYRVSQRVDEEDYVSRDEADDDKQIAEERGYQRGYDEGRRVAKDGGTPGADAKAS